MNTIICLLLLVTTLFIGGNSCKEPNRSLDFATNSEYDFINNEYKNYLRSIDSGLKLYEHPLNVNYFMDDTLIAFNTLFVLDKVNVEGLIDSSNSWDLSKIKDFRVISKHEARRLLKQRDFSFNSHGFVTISKPYLSINKKYMVMKQYIINFEYGDIVTSSTLLFFKRLGDEWVYFEYK